MTGRAGRAHTETARQTPAWRFVWEGVRHSVGFWLAVCLSLAGIGVFALVTAVVGPNQQLDRGGAQTAALVLGRRQVVNDAQGSDDYLTLAYRDQHGAVHRQDLAVKPATYDQGAQGAVIPILFDPAHPSQINTVEAVEATSAWSRPVMAGAIVATGIGLLLIWLAVWRSLHRLAGLRGARST